MSITLTDSIFIEMYFRVTTNNGSPFLFCKYFSKYIAEINPPISFL